MAVCPSPARNRLGVLLLLMCVGQATVAAASQWNIEFVDGSRRFADMTDRSLRIDAEGNPHIAYGGVRLWYVWYDGDGWCYEVVDDDRSVGSHATLALDADGYPHIGYYDDEAGDLKHAHKDAFGWHVEVVDSAGDVGQHPSLAVGGSGTPHITYCDCTNDDLKYASGIASGWDIEVVDSLVGGHTSLALGGSGLPHVSYDGATGTMYAHRDALGWHIETVDSLGNGDTSLALDGSACPHVSYSRYPDLRYAYNDGSGWHTESVDVLNHAEYLSLVMDEDGHPHIACGELGEHLGYAYRDSSGWHGEEVPGVSNICFDVSLGLGTDECSHISYYGFHVVSCIGRFILGHALKDPSGWQIDVLDTQSHDANYYAFGVSSTLDAADKPHVSYGHYSYGNTDVLQYASTGPSGWAVETVYPDLGQSSYSPIAVSADGVPHIAFQVRDRVEYSYRDELGWHTATIDSEIGSHGGQPSLALTETGAPRISYYDIWPEEGLKYAWENDGDWEIEHIDDPGRIDEICLALDHAGFPHIVFDADTRGYAYEDAQGWHTEYGVPVGTQISMALDANGAPHVSSRTLWPDEQLQYTYREGPLWHVETVDSISECSGTSLDLDEGGHPHVAYTTFDLTTMKGEIGYAYREGTSWRTEPVEPAEGWFGSVCLLLDSSGMPRVCYLDGDQACIKYAARADVPAHEGRDTLRVAATVRLLSVRPNPACSETRLWYACGLSTTRSQRVLSISVHDALGRLVSVLTEGPAREGPRCTRWDLRTAHGDLVGPGVYFLRLEAGNPRASAVGRLVVVR